MDLYPAIDLLAGRCVRLYQGDYDKQTVYGDDPVARAAAFARAGVPWIHVVDLDAARTGVAANRELIADIAAAVDVPVQAGGGVRSPEAAASLFAVGVERVVVGTAALADPELVGHIARHHRVAVGLDSRAGEVATDGWLSGSGRGVLDVARAFCDVGVDALVVTDIARDGTLEGPDLVGLRELLAVTELDVIASGGVGTLADLEALARVEVDDRRPAGVIVGKAIHDGEFSVADALGVLGGGGE